MTTNANGRSIEAMRAQGLLHEYRCVGPVSHSREPKSSVSATEVVHYATEDCMGNSYVYSGRVEEQAGKPVWVDAGSGYRE